MISYNKTVFTSFLIIFATIGIGYGQKIFIDENISYWYNVNNDVHMNHNIYFEGDSAYLYLEIDFNDKLFDDFHYMIEYHESYHKLDIDQADTIIIQDHIIAFCLVDFGKCTVDVFFKSIYIIIKAKTSYCKAGGLFR